MEDPPPDWIIDDDSELDAFMKARKTKADQAAMKARLEAAKNKSKGGGGRSREKLL